MLTRFLADAADLAAEYPDAYPPKNGLPWQSTKLGVNVLESDQNGCVFLIVRHDPLQPKPSRLVRKFFSDPEVPHAAVAIVECVSEAERAALLTPIQTMIAALEEEAASGPDLRTRSAETIDLDASVPPPEPSARLGDVLKKQFDALRNAAAKAIDQPQYKTPLNPESEWQSHSVQSLYLTDMAQFNNRFPAIQPPKNILPSRSTDRSTFVFTASGDSDYFAMLVRENLELSERNRYVRSAFKALPDAYAWVVRFEDRLMRDTFALGLQCRLFGSLLDRSEPDDPPVGGDDPSGGPGPRGDGDAGVPAVTVRPKPSRSGSDAKELPEEDEPEIFHFGPEELAETPMEPELVPARVEM